MSKKALSYLAICTAIAVVAAIWAVQQEWSRWGSNDYGTKLFPELASKLDDVARVRLRHGDTTITLDRTAKGWAVHESDDYPAHSNAVQELLYALSEARRVEPKTREEKKFAKLEVDDPTKPNSKAKRVDVLDKSGHSLASLILGKENLLLQAIGEGGAYVRFPDQKQTWLASGNLVAGDDFKDWLDNPIINVPRQRIARAVLTHPNGDRMVVSKSPKDDGKFILEGMASDEKLISQYYPSDIVRVFEKFEVDQAQRAGKIKFLPKATMKGEYHTIEGMTITVELTTIDGKDWMRFDSITADGAPSSSLEADRKAIESSTMGWAFLLPEYESIHLKKLRSETVEKVKPQS
jgi:Domain of unknown function (DUF4340)